MEKMELPETAFKSTTEGSTLRCRVQPGASRSSVVGAYGEEVKIALQAPPVDGKANAALCKMIADLCGIPKGQVSIRSGETSRSKVVAVTGVAADTLKNILSKE